MNLAFCDGFSIKGIQKIIPAKGKLFCFEPSGQFILIVVRGHLIPPESQKKEKPIEWGEMIFLPSGRNLSFFPGNATELLLFHIPDCLDLLHKFLPSSISNLRRKYKNKESIPYPLTLTPILWEYIRNLQIIMDENNSSPMLGRIKIFELFCLLSTCYPNDSLSTFFSPVLSEENGFSNFVWQNYHKVKSVEEFARLYNQSTSCFEKKFKSFFGIAPYRWMTERKKEQVYQGIIHSGCPIQELSDKYGFSSPSQLNDFCKKHMGMTPGQLRRSSKL